MLCLVSAMVMKHVILDCVCVMCSMNSLIFVKSSCNFIHRTLVSRVKGGFCSIVRLWFKLLPGFGEQVRVVLLLGFGEQTRVVPCKS